MMLEEKRFEMNVCKVIRVGSNGECDGNGFAVVSVSVCCLP